MNSKYLKFACDLTPNFFSYYLILSSKGWLCFKILSEKVIVYRIKRNWCVQGWCLVFKNFDRNVIELLKLWHLPECENLF